MGWIDDLDAMLEKWARARRSRRKNRHCVTCGKLLPKGRSKYCGDGCAGKLRKRETCLVCGAPLPRGRGTYCSEQCYHKAQQEQERKRKEREAQDEPQVDDTLKPAFRLCLGGCEEPFLSEGPWHRICPRCRERQDPLRALSTDRALCIGETADEALVHEFIVGP